LNAGPQRIRALAFSADGDRIAAAGDGPFLRLWTVSDGAEIKYFVSRPGRVMALVFCSDDLIATGSSDNVIRIWSIDAAQEIYRLVGHEGSVSSLEFSPGEQLLLSGSFDTTICFWKLPTDPAAATARGPAARTSK
jgi:WD40 repeat protein